MIKSLKDLEKAIKLCRKMGVESIKIDGVEFHLGPVYFPQKRQVTEKKINSLSPGGITDGVQIPAANIPTDGLTEEQLLFFSSDSTSGEHQ